MSSEEAYIKKRKKQAKKLTKCFKLMGFFPIKNNKIVVSTFEGDGGYCCNPRYIVEELLKRDDNLEIVWLTHDVNREFPQGIKVVQDTMINKVFHLSTARVWIDNYRKPLGTVKRKNQLYIQTWHASIGFKAVGLYRGELFPKIAYIVSEADSSLADYFISNSEYCDKIYPRKLLYSGPIIHSGSPRVDCLINRKDELHREIRDRYEIDKETKLVMFAPTFRGGNQKEEKKVSSSIPNISFECLLKVLSDTWGGEWKCLLRLHPQVSAKMREISFCERSDKIIDVSQAPDISELIAACDVLITDYSSCAFDALFAHIPVFLYAEDVQEYIQDRGQFMWTREELPFDFAENSEELKDIIEKFDLQKYIFRANEFMKKNGVKEDGHASERVADVIENYMRK